MIRAIFNFKIIEEWNLTTISSHNP